MAVGVMKGYLRSSDWPVWVCQTNKVINGSFLVDSSLCIVSVRSGLLLLYLQCDEQDCGTGRLWWTVCR